LPQFFLFLPLRLVDLAANGPFFLKVLAGLSFQPLSFSSAGWFSSGLSYTPFGGLFSVTSLCRLFWGPFFFFPSLQYPSHCLIPFSVEWWPDVHPCIMSHRPFPPRINLVWSILFFFWFCRDHPLRVVPLLFKKLYYVIVDPTGVFFFPPHVTLFCLFSRRTVSIMFRVLTEMSRYVSLLAPSFCSWLSGFFWRFSLGRTCKRPILACSLGAAYLPSQSFSFFTGCFFFFVPLLPSHHICHCDFPSFAENRLMARFFFSPCASLHPHLARPGFRSGGVLTAHVSLFVFVCPQSCADSPFCPCGLVHPEIICFFSLLPRQCGFFSDSPPFLGCGYAFFCWAYLRPPVAYSLPRVRTSLFFVLRSCLASFLHL